MSLHIQRPTKAAPLSAYAHRVAALEALFTTIAHTRMAGVPVLNRALQVQALGFEPLPPQEGDATAATAPAPAAVGILITPWFMNLVRLPLQPEPTAQGVGRSQRHAVGNGAFDFIGAHEPAIGAYSACSLFSPVFEFVDQAAARATAQAVLATLRAAAPQASEPPPARRAFLLGRSAARGAAA